MKNIIFLFFLIIHPMNADYSSHPVSKSVIDELSNKHGFSKNYVKDVLKNAQKQQKILDSISKPAEFNWTWQRYKNLFIEDNRIINGKSFINENIETLLRAEKEFGVPKEIITAILGVETRYGKIQGSYRVLDSLTTLGFDYPRRSKFFKDELIKFFLLTRENNLDIFSVKGSYAGAMGYGQFISSSYRAYAIDFDNDGKVDLFNSVDDAIGSIANYLYVHGWRRNGNIVKEISFNNVRSPYKHIGDSSKFIPLKFTEGINMEYEVKEGDTFSEIASKNNISANKLKNLNDIKDINLIKTGDIIIISKEKDLHFIGDENFIAITKYNISHFYAMAVYYLAEEFKK